MCWYQKQTSAQARANSKLIYGGPRGGGGGGTPKPRQSICLLNMDWYQKTLAPYVKPFKKLMFGVATWGVPGRVVPQNYVKVFALLLSLDIKHVVA